MADQGDNRSDAGGASWAGLAALGIAAGAGPLVTALAVGRGLPVAALVSAVVLVLVLLIAVRLRRPAASSSAPSAAELASAAVSPEATLPLAELVDALAAPILLIAAREAEDLTDRRILLANRAARELFRITREGGLLATAVRAPEVLEAVDEALFGAVCGRAAYASGGAQDRVWLALAQPLASEPGGPSLALLTLSDETEVRRAERTRADFLANASHELRTPLASLTGFIETLRGHAREDPAARDRFLGIMQVQAERMRRLIEDLMSLSRIELNEHIAPSGKVDLALASVDVMDALAPLAAERQVSLDTAFPGKGEALVAGERDQLLQVVQNLTENALKYSPAGSVIALNIRTGLTAAEAAAPCRPEGAHLSLLTPDHAAERRYVAFSVRDAGPGIAREHLPRLTERFYRVEGQKSGGERSGTGLGLAIVKHIVNRHRGGLCVESVEGAGAVFTAYLPMLDPAAVPAAAAAA